MLESADFDGSNDYMTRGAGLTGAADSKTGIASFWVRLDGGDSSVQSFVTGATHFAINRGTGGGVFQVLGYNASSTVILSMISSTGHSASSTWLHVLASWDLASTTGKIYVNDVDDTSGSSFFSNDSIDYTDTDNAVGAFTDGTNKVNGCLAEVYFAPGQYLDFSVVNNRRRFITSSGKPVYLGADGAGPTGTAPLVYFHLSPSEAVANFATNRGTGGNFTITGVLAAGSTSPSDF